MGVMVYSVFWGNIALRTSDYGKYGRFLVMGHAGFISLTVSRLGKPKDQAQTFAFPRREGAPGTGTTTPYYYHYYY